MKKILYRRGKTVVRRQILKPGQAMPWHRDPCDRITTILSGDAIAIEFRDPKKRKQMFKVKPGQVDWDKPTLDVHRGVNVGKKVYEEIVVFLLENEGDDPQPVVR